VKVDKPEAHFMTKRKALCVGINNYKNFPDASLNGCIHDVETMTKVMRYLNVISIKTLTDKDATKKAIITELEKLINDDPDWIGFSFSGHGTQYPRADEPDGLGEALVCYDLAEKGDEWDMNTIITDRELRSILDKAHCVVELWLDSCFSGGMTRVLRRQKSRFISMPGHRELSLPQMSDSKMSSGPGRNLVFWVAASEAQEAADAWFQNGAEGAFTHFWNQSFFSNPKNPRVQLIAETRAELASYNFSQFARLKCWNAEAQTTVGV
jgi:hypothetical protein